MCDKLITTLGETLSMMLDMRTCRYLELISVIKNCKPHARMCLFRTLIGGWTTSHRMHEPIKHDCLFGCRGEPDDIRHYLLCAPLWMVVGETIGEQSPYLLADRICYDKVSPFSVVRLAIAFHCYQYVKSLCSGESPQINIADKRALQRAAFEACKTFYNHLT